jgi:hypothetical protein
MKKLNLFAFFLWVCIQPNLWGQGHPEFDLNTPIRFSSLNYLGAEIPADATVPTSIKPSNPSTHQPEAMFDVQFILRANDSLPLGTPRRSFGLHWTGTEFWVSQWTSDSVARFSKEGRLLGMYKVLGLPFAQGNSGIRHYTREGANLWAVNNSDTLLRLNPTTGQIVQKIGMPASIGQIRYVAWDNTEGGGFWVGNTSTDFFKINKSAQIIRTIPRSVHGLFAVNGLVYDSLSVGGPYLWANCQSDFDNVLKGAFIRQVKISSGLGTSLVRDIKMDVPALSANFGGSITIAQIPGFTKPSLIAIAQNTTAHPGVVIAYELDFAPLSTIDVGLDSLETLNGFTLVPRRHNLPAALKAKARNIGFANATNATILTELYKSNFDLATRRNSQTTIPSLSFQTVTVLDTYVPTDTDSYFGLTIIKAAGDINPLNDTARVYFAVKDSTYAKDFVDIPNAALSSLSIGAGAALPLQKKLGISYRLPVASTINSVTFRSRPSISGDTIQIKIYKMGANGQVGDSIAASSFYRTTAQDSTVSIPATGAIIRTLPLTRPLSIQANEEILICLAEGRSSMRLTATARGYQPRGTYAFGTFWINTDTLANAAFRAALYLRPNINLRTDILETRQNIADVQVYPNPVQDNLAVQVALTEKDEVTIDLKNMAGQTVLQDKLGRELFLTKNYPLSILPNGLYILTVRTARGIWQEKIVKGQ